MIQHLVPFQWSVEIGHNMMWRIEELNEFNIVETYNTTEGHVTHLHLPKLEHAAHSPTGRVELQADEREEC